MSERSVLVITHNYPPIQGAGVEPPLEFGRYLPEFGYRPLVLTTGRYGGLATDEAAHVYRAGDLLHDLFRPLRRRREQGVPQEAQYRVATIANRSPLGRLRDAVLMPDTKVGWLPAAVRLGRELIDRYQPSMIYSSSPPETNHLVGLSLHRSSGLPWVADFRDGWMFEPPNAPARLRAPRRWLEGRWEAHTVGSASRITAATDPITEDLRGRYPRAARRIETITNGYDRLEFAERSRQRGPDGTFLLIYTGSLSASRQGTTAGAIFDGLVRLAELRPDLTVRVSFVGNISDEEKAAARARGLADSVTFLPAVSQSEAHQYQLDADALLLVTAPGQRSVATLKLFDYIGAGVPILALAQDNAAADIVRGYGLGITVPPDDPAAVATALIDLILKQQAGTIWPGFARAQADFEWRKLTSRLAAAFDEAAAPCLSMKEDKK